MHHAFSQLAAHVSDAMGHPLAFLLAVLFIIGWAGTGPLFRFSETWQLVINTSTTIVTFLVVFLIQNTQNRDRVAMQLKLDNLTLALKDASNSLLKAEEKTPEELRLIRDELSEKGHYEEG